MTGPELRCGRGDSREGTMFPAEFEPIKHDESQAAFEDRILHAVRCSVHAGAAKRVRWGPGPRDYVPLTTANREAALRAIRRRAEAEQIRQAERDVANKERIKAITRHSWAELDKEPDYVVRYEEENRTLTHYRTDRMWSIFDPNDLARKERGETEWAHHLLQVTIEDRDQYEDVTTPAELNMHISSRLTTKLAGVLSGVLAEASAKAVELNVERRARFEGQAATWEGDKPTS